MKLSTTHNISSQQVTEKVMSTTYYINHFFRIVSFTTFISLSIMHAYIYIDISIYPIIDTHVHVDELSSLNADLFASF